MEWRLAMHRSSVTEFIAGGSGRLLLRQQQVVVSGVFFHLKEERQRKKARNAALAYHLLGTTTPDNQISKNLRFLRRILLLFLVIVNFVVSEMK
jgi:hypothetical protein